MADDEAKDGQDEKKPSLIKKLMIPVALVAVSSGATFGGLKFTGMLDPAPAAEGEGGEAMSAEATATAADSSHVGKPAHFFTLYPDMLVNFSSDGRPAYLKLSMDVMAHNEAVITAVEQYQTIIRSTLLAEFQAYEFDSSNRTQSVEAMRTLAHEKTREVLDKYHGSSDIEGVYFTSFVVQ